MVMRCLRFGFLLILASLFGTVGLFAEQYSYQFEGQFRPGHEGVKAVDGDTSTSAVPDAYNDSVAVIEEYPIPPGVTEAIWQFRVLRNNPDITISVYYWDAISRNWISFYDVPQSDQYMTYRVAIPSGAFASSSLRTKVKIKNASAMSGEYFEGLVDWVYTGTTYYSCEGTFRTSQDKDCSMAVDGDTATLACPDAYNDSAFVTEDYIIPPLAEGAIWQFRALNNNACIKIEARYWDYMSNQWVMFYNVPQDDRYITH